MRRMHFLWGGVFLLLVSSGCSSDKTLSGGGVYAPVIAGVSGDPEPAVRGELNQLTAIVTNVNSYPIEYHWSSPWGVFSDSTHQAATWTAPDSVGTYPVTCSIVATGDGVTFYKSTTFQIFVDNKYVRWTHSDQIQFDPAPTSVGGVVYSEYRNISAQTADVYSVPVSGMDPVRLTSGIYAAFSPTMRADMQQFAFVGRPTSSDSIGLWLMPGGGGNASSVTNLASWNPQQRFLGSPRFERIGTRLLYGSDSSNVFNPKPWYLDVLTPGSTIHRVFAAGQQGINTFYPSNWGPNGDSVVCTSYRGFGTTTLVPRGLFKLPTEPEQSGATQWLADSSASDPDWSSDGGYIIFTRFNPISASGVPAERDIWIIAANATDKNQAIRVTFGPADDSHPRFSDDGSTIFFVSTRADRYGLNGVFPTERRGTNIWSVSAFDKP
jgi:hypothetical protein